MSDWREPIPKLLRAHRERVHDLSGVGYVCPSICEIAADEIERLRYTLATAREEGRRANRLEEAWQPIETAPKDGATILAYFPLEGLSDDWDRMVPVRYSQFHGRWIFSGRAVAGYSDCYQPTHWMPR